MATAEHRRVPYMTWEEICREYPNEYVRLVDERYVMNGELHPSGGCVVDHDVSDAALLKRPQRGMIDFTGTNVVVSMPLRVLVDEVDLEICREPVVFRVVGERSPT